jgi:transcriptional regulator of arginine metabolism
MPAVRLHGSVLETVETAEGIDEGGVGERIGVVVFSQRVLIETQHITRTWATMDTKQLRHKKIVELVEQRALTRQEEIVTSLAECGILVSQSTLSKDITQLGLVKTRNVDGTARWRLPVQHATPQSLKRLHRALEDHLLHCDTAQHLLVLKTTPGYAQGVCAAIDAMNWPEILGTLAGNDTIVIVSKTVKEATTVMARITEIVGMKA